MDIGTGSSRKKKGICYTIKVKLEACEHTKKMSLEKAEKIAPLQPS